MKLRELLEDKYLDYCWDESRLKEEMAKKIKRNERVSYLKDWLLAHGVHISSRDKKKIEQGDKEAIKNNALKNLDWIFRREYWNGCYELGKNGSYAVVKDNWGFHQLEDFYRKIRELPDDKD